MLIMLMLIMLIDNFKIMWDITKRKKIRAMSNSQVVMEFTGQMPIRLITPIKENALGGSNGR